MTEQEAPTALRSVLDGGWNQGQLIALANDERITRLKEQRVASQTRQAVLSAAAGKTALLAAMKADILALGGHNDTRQALWDLFVAIRDNDAAGAWHALMDLVDAKSNEHPDIRQGVGI